MSEYNNLVASLDEQKCLNCGGLGEQDDADFGDMYYNKWKCPDCKGTGIRGGANISMEVSNGR